MRTGDYIRDHNSRVIEQSDSRLDPPDPNEPGFMKDDFYIPEHSRVKITCFRDHDIGDESCVVCERSIKQIIEEDQDDAFGCYEQSREEGDHYVFELRGHICMACWLEIPDRGAAP